MKALLVSTIVTAFLVAESLRFAQPARATVASMVGWGSFGVLCLAWLWEDCGAREGLRRLGRFAVLTGVAFLVILLYYRRSHLLEAGIDVDAGYTFIGLGNFARLAGPITYAGRTPSFPQFPMQLLGHLPGYLIGFDRLGPFAVHLGMLLQVAALLALATTFVVDGALVVQAVTVAAVAAVFTNRLTLLLCNLTGYGIPAMSVGIVFLVIVLRPAPPSVLFPRVGGLLLLALLHHYPGIFFVLPLVLLWVVAGPQPWWRLADFLRANLPLCVAASIGLVCVAVHPVLLLMRLRDVTTPSMDAGELRKKVIENWGFLTGGFGPMFVRMFFVVSPGSWHLLNIAPLGGHLAEIVAADWVVTALALGRRACVYVGGLVVLFTGLALLTGLQHLVTGFESYRDMMLVLGMVTPGVGFVLLTPRARPLARVLLVGWAAAVATYSYADVAELAGKRYAVVENAPVAQAAMEVLRGFWWRVGEHRLDGAAVGVVVPAPFRISPLYVEAARAHGIALRFLDPNAFCANPVAAVTELLAAQCGPVGLAVAPAMCGGAWRRALAWPRPPGTEALALYRFDSICGTSGSRDTSVPKIVDLAPLPAAP